MTKFICMICGHEYDPEKGEPKQDIPAGIQFHALPGEWTCPICGAEKRLFKEA